VASDDQEVLHDAHRYGMMINSEIGVSQLAGQLGVEYHLKEHKEAGYNASLEVISDIYFLSKCSSLVGMASSQVYRMAVGNSLAEGNLHYTIATDFASLGDIVRLSWWMRLIVPEPFHSPDGKSIHVF
jgi:hypothetical protein